MIKRRMEEVKRVHFKLKPPAIIALSFLLVIFVGSGLLMLPGMTNEGMGITYLEAIFTSTSATCVTGLVNIGEGVAATFSIYGRIVIAILIQLGGLGVTTLAVAVFLIVTDSLSLSQQSLIKEGWNLSSFKSLRVIFFRVLVLSFIFEFLGAVLSFTDFYFIHQFPLDEAIGLGVFHSVSAFNNAGFDLFGTTSIIAFQNDVYLNFITGFLIVCGGLGYFAILDIFAKQLNFKKFMLHTKIVVTFTISLIILGGVGLYLLEIGNESNLNFLGSFFLSVSTRTAGFTTYDLSKFSDASLILMILLMFIGASPGGTGGGIKTTTFALLFYYVIGIISKRHPSAFNRSLSKNQIRRAEVIILLGLGFFIIGFFAITIFERDFGYILNGEKIKYYVEGSLRFSPMDYSFEVMSAFGTVGLSTGITSYFSSGSQIVLIILMYVGRIGPLTISSVYSSNNIKHYRYATEEVSIG